MIVLPFFGRFGAFLFGDTKALRSQPASALGSWSSGKDSFPSQAGTMVAKTIFGSLPPEIPTKKTSKPETMKTASAVLGFVVLAWSCPYNL